MKRLQAINGIISGCILLCLVVGWFQLLSPELNVLLYRRLFYFLIGVSFVIQSKFLSNPKFVYPMYGAAALCMIGAFLPLESNFDSVKTIGLFAGVIISIFNRQRVQR